MKYFLLPLLLAPTLALAQPLSTGALEQMAHGSEESRGIAYGYVVGVLESRDSRLICVPARVTEEDLAQTVTRDLDRASPELSAAQWLLAQLLRHYPCK
jgi:hypothetical protein